MRNTKIVCTVGPATAKPEVLRELLAAGASVLRFNMSHAKHDWVREVAALARQLADEMGLNVALLMDSQGPSIRTGDLATPLDLKPGDIFEFTVKGEKSEDLYSVDVNYDGLIDDIHVGDTVLVDNGVLHLEVLEKAGNRIRCRVLTEATLGSRRHINLPGVRVNMPALTEKDRADIAVGVEVGMDFFALSFVNEAGDIDTLREYLSSLGSEASIVAKIETQHAVQNLNAIVRATDAVMVARGDLGIECPMEELPIIQRRIVKRCLRFNRPVIVATHMLESMISAPVPTRAEVTDVANAVFEQADAIMLSGESAMGKYPVKCVEVLDKIARRIERSGGAGYGEEMILELDRQKTVNCAITLANSLPGSKLVVFTRHGVVAGYTSGQRPSHSPIFAFTPNPSTAKRLALNWGTQAFVLAMDENPSVTIRQAMDVLIGRGLVTTGDRLVIVSDILAGEFVADSVQLRIV